MQSAVAVNDDAEIWQDVAPEVDAILAEYGVSTDSIVDMALSKGHARTIIRDAANDDEASDTAIPA